MRALSGILIVGMSLGGCFYMPVVSKGKVSALDEAPRLATAISSTESKAMSSYDPNSRVATTIPAPTGALAGSSVTLQAGALSIAVDLVVEEAVPLTETSLTNSLAISSNIAIMPVGSGLIIRPTENVDLTKPLTIAMPVSPSAGLHGWLSGMLALNADKSYVVFYKYFFEGELRAGLIPSDVLRKGADGSIVFEGYFGAYWLAEVSEPITAKVEILTTEPIMNKEKVAVISNTGVVTETEIVAKAAIPVVDWKSIKLTLDSSNRTVSASATIGSGRTVSSCVLDLFEKTDSSTGINIETDSSLSKSYSVVKQEAHTLYARFRCIDDQQRLTLSGWSLPVTLSGSSTFTDMCGTNPPELRFYIGAMGASMGGPKPTTASPSPSPSPYPSASPTPWPSPSPMPIPSLSFLRSFTSNGACMYSLELDTMSDIAFAIQTSDGKTNCSSATASVGAQALSCSEATGSLAPMTLPQGNYTFNVDFSGSRTSPKLSIALQPCALNDMYLVRTDSYNNNVMDPPAAANRLNHIGGCQYTIQMPSYATEYSYRVQNESGSYMCGEQTVLQLDYPALISCGTSRPSFTLSMMGGSPYGNRYIVNLGSNLDMHGQTTSQPYVSMSTYDYCLDKLYILGPTSVGQNRVQGVNSFRKNSNCSFNYLWENSATLSPFYIGIGEGTQKCGAAPGSTPMMPTNLYCGPDAIPVELPSNMLQGQSQIISVNYDVYTGQPSNLHVWEPTCSEMFYVSKDSTAGFQPSSSKVFTEVKECLYQYDWTPSAGDHDLIFVSGNSASYRCGRFLGMTNPVVNGAPTDILCSSSIATANFPIAPIGIVDGTRYRITLDKRMSSDGISKVSIAPLPAVSCPDLHVTGVDFDESPIVGNRMTRTGDCSYNFKFHYAGLSSPINFKIKDSTATKICGYLNTNPDQNWRSVSMDCNGSPEPLSIYVSQNTDYQIQVSYDANGTSTVEVNNYYGDYCPSIQLDGPAAFDHSGGVFNFTQVENCVDEFVWMPMSLVDSFRLKTTYNGYNAYCGLDFGSPQLNLGIERSAICNIFNVANTTNFVVSEGVQAGETYLIRIDRRGTFFAPPKIKVEHIGP